MRSLTTGISSSANAASALSSAIKWRGWFPHWVMRATQWSARIDLDHTRTEGENRRAYLALSRAPPMIQIAFAGGAGYASTAWRPAGVIFMRMTSTGWRPARTVDALAVA
jgi:hypothetical protein